MVAVGGSMVHGYFTMGFFGWPHLLMGILVILTGLVTALACCDMRRKQSDFSKLPEWALGLLGMICIILGSVLVIQQVISDRFEWGGALVGVVVVISGVVQLRRIRAGQTYGTDAGQNRS